MGIKKGMLWFWMILASVFLISAPVYASSSFPQFGSDIIDLDQELNGGGSWQDESWDEGIWEGETAPPVFTLFERVIFVGDSRIDEMFRYLHASHSEAIAKGRMGLEWFRTEARFMLEDRLQEDEGRTAVVFNLGINDLRAKNPDRQRMGDIYYEYFSTYIPRLVADYDCTVYYMSVNPVDEAFAAASGHIRYESDIERMNLRLSQLPECHYIDVYFYLKRHNGMDGSRDGLHYSPQVYQTIYKFAIKSIGKYEENGTMVGQIQFRKNGDQWYCYQSSGRPYSSKWISYKGEIYYINQDGSVLCNTWKQHKGKWYYLTESGAAAKGWIKYNGRLYCMDGSGKMIVNKWISYRDNLYYVDDSGKALRNEWKKHKSTWYYLTGNSTGAKGWRKIEGKYYYFNDKCKMQADKWLDDRQYRCYVGADGARLTDQLIDFRGYTFYVNKNGHMVKDTTIVLNGKHYTFDSKGKMIK